VRALYIGVFLLPCASINANSEDMVLIPDGYYTPLFKDEDGPQTIEVKSFYMDQYPVTNKQFDVFIKKNKKWNKENIKPIFSDSNYLKHFSEEVMNDIAEQPVTNVSWFAARAYCKSVNKRLPTSGEWEYVAKASHDLADGSKQAEYRQQILEWYSRPATDALPNVQDTPSNYWQVHGLHGVVWELVSDFNTALVTGESRGDTQLDKQLFCGAGAASSVDPNDYAAFMRYAMRSSYSAHYTIESLGFRCAKDIAGE
jgi:formylglycine-generating enzyme required for sulfatase activity